MEHARHVLRILLLLLVVFVVVVLVRPFVVPKSYGLHGPYRYDNVAEQASARPPLHGGAASCGACHEERLAAASKGAHKTVNCEVCHAPLGVHVRDGSLVAAMPVDRSYGQCLRCHRKLEGRPPEFPQIVLAQHADGATKGRACLECHDPHSPTP